MVIVPALLPRDKNDGSGCFSSIIVTAYSDLRIDVDVMKVVDRRAENACPKELKGEVSLFIEKPEIDPWIWNELALVQQIDRMDIASDNIRSRLRRKDPNIVPLLCIFHVIVLGIVDGCTA